MKQSALCGVGTAGLGVDGKPRPVAGVARLSANFGWRPKPVQPPIVFG
jgi:hypothetical protein